MSWSLDGRPLRRILISRLRYLGDVVMSTALIDVLRRGDPELQIGYLCEEAYASALAGRDDLRRLHVLSTRRGGADGTARPSVDEPGSGAEGGVVSGGWLATVLSLRRERYDLAVDLFFNPRSAWLLRSSGIPARITGRRNRRARLYTHVAERVADPILDALAPGGLGEHLARLAPLTHVETGLPLPAWLAAQGEPLRPRLEIPAAADEAATRALAVAGESGGPFVVLAPGATWASKSWPAERWRDLAATFCGAGIPTVILSPPGRDAALSEALAGTPATVLPPLPLSTVFAVLKRGRGTVAVDGGVMHASVALGRPTVAVFGPTDPGIWFPYEHLGPYRVLATRPHCHPCDLHDCDAWICMPGVAVDDVLASLTTLMLGGDPS